MKKITNLIVEGILQSSKNMISIFLLLMCMNNYGQEVDSLKVENLLTIELNENNSQVNIIFINKTTDTLSVSNLYHFDNLNKPSYFNFCWYDADQKEYNTGGLINIVEEPFFLLDDKTKSRMVKIPPKTKIYYPMGYFGKIQMFLEFQTIISYKGRSFFLKGWTNEINTK